MSIDQVLYLLAQKLGRKLLGTPDTGRFASHVEAPSCFEPFLFPRGFLSRVAIRYQIRRGSITRYDTLGESHACNSMRCVAASAASKQTSHTETCRISDDDAKQGQAGWRAQTWTGGCFMLRTGCFSRSPPLEPHPNKHVPASDQSWLAPARVTEGQERNRQDICVQLRPLLASKTRPEISYKSLSPCWGIAVFRYGMWSRRHRC